MSQWYEVEVRVLLGFGDESDTEAALCRIVRWGGVGDFAGGDPEGPKVSVGGFGLEG